MHRTVFIASSAEARPKVEQVRAILSKIDGLRALPWYDTGAFPPALFPLEAIDRQTRQIAGAVLLATPDDPAFVHGRNVVTPRANVMMELGYFAAILRREQTALCCYDEVELPSDLKGFTYIRMGRYSDCPDEGCISEDSAEQLRKWAASLPSVAPGLPQAEVFHGYTGLWSYEMDLSVYRGIAIDQERGDYAKAEGSLLLCVDRDMHVGHGCSYGDLYVRIGDCFVQFKLNGVIRRVLFRPDGSLRFRETLTKHLVQIEGDRPQSEGFDHEPPGPNQFQWRLRPNWRGESKLEGTYQLLIGRRPHSNAKVVAEKSDTLAF